jgi:N-acetylglucosamine kinase-like BadF-type ATPase
MKYVVGVDGGGTKTAGLLADLEGHVLAQGSVGPTNYQVVGSSGIIKEIPRLVHGLFASAHVPGEELASLALGFAGVGRPGEPERVAAIVEDLHLARKEVVDHDAMIALVGALGDQPGLIVIAGTGSIALGRNAQGQRARSGGWGYLLGDEGSGYYVARQALMAVLKAFDGRAGETTLTERLLGELGLQTAEEIIPRVYHRGLSHDEIATLAPLVFDAARKGDAVAKGIVDRAGRELGLMATAVISKLGMGSGNVTIGLVGSLFRDKDLLLEPMQAAVSQVAQPEFIEPRLGPVQGATILALKAAGVVVTPAMLRSLQDDTAELNRKRQQS